VYQESRTAEFREELRMKVTETTLSCLLLAKERNRLKSPLVLGRNGIVGQEQSQGRSKLVEIVCWERCASERKGSRRGASSCHSSGTKWCTANCTEYSLVVLINVVNLQVFWRLK